MRWNKMEDTYTPVTREELVKMDDGQLLSQYQSLIDVIIELEGISFERNPQIPREKLIQLINSRQINYLNDVSRGTQQ